MVYGAGHLIYELAVRHQMLGDPVRIPGSDDYERRRSSGGIERHSNFDCQRERVAFGLSKWLLQLRNAGATPSGVPFTAQAWKFRNGPAFVFPSGEVCIDFQLRIKRELGESMWPIAYANATPCYVVSKRMLNKGGYEAENSMFYYGWLRSLRPTAEDAVMTAVGKVVE